MNKVIRLYTDGSYDPKTKAGGIGICLYIEDTNRTLCFYGGKINTSSQEMELQAISHSLLWLQLNDFREHVVILNTDYHPAFLGLKNNNHNLFYNDTELWNDTLVSYHNFKNITPRWVKGHAGSLLNETADKLAEKGRLYANERKNSQIELYLEKSDFK